MRLIFFICANATGKSTRIRKVVDSLGENYKPIMFNKKEVGRIYTERKIAIIGKRSKDGKWGSMDSFPTNDWDERFIFFKSLVQDNDIDTLILEGYFNCVAVKSRPNKWRENGFDELQFYFFLYDTVEEFLDRINIRLNGKDIKTLEWAKTSSGWNDNCGRLKKAFNDFSLEKSDKDVVEKLHFSTDINYFVKLLSLEEPLETNLGKHKVSLLDL